MIYEQGSRRDEVYQGRMILLVIGLGCLCLWILDYFTWPVMLVPAAYFDPSGHALSVLIGMLFQFAIMSTFWIFTWAGYTWARYILGIFLLVGGMVDIILSILLDSSGGAFLVFGAMCVASAAALMISLGVHRYVEDRRAKGPPLLMMGLYVMATFFLLLGVAGLQLAQTWIMVDTSQREMIVAQDPFKRLVPNLNLAALDPISSDAFKQEMVDSDLQAQVDEIKKTLGPYQSWMGLKPPSVKELVMDPSLSREKQKWHTLLLYEKGDLFVRMEIDVSQSPAEVKSIYFQRFGKDKPSN